MAENSKSSGTPFIRDLSKASKEVLRRPRGLDPKHSNQENGPVFCAYEPAVFSREVHQKEDTVVSATLETRLEALSLRKQRYPCRSEYVSGNAINLRTNYFEVQTNPNAQLFRYTVSIANLDSKQNRKKRHIIELLLDHPLLRAALPVLATDFVGLIVTAEKLTLERTRGDKDIQEFDIQYKNEGQTTVDPNAPIYKVKLESDGVVSFAALNQYLNSPFAQTSFDKEAAITALNIVLTWTPTLNPTVLSGAKNTKFYPLEGAEEAAIGPGLIALKGYYASVRTSIGRLLVNVNVCTSAFVRDGRLDLIMQLFNGPRPAETFLMKRRISTDYLGSKRFRVIHGFAKDEKTQKYLNAQQKIIRLQDGSNISVAEFFRREHRNGVPLVHPNLPLILAGTSKIGGREVPCWIPAEECQLVPGQPYSRKLSGQETTAMLEFAALPPAENARRIVAEAARVLGLDLNNKRLPNFGVRVNNKMIVVEGRKLKEPSIRYKQKTLAGTNGSWSMGGVTFAKAGDILNWSTLKVTMPMEQPNQRKPITAETINEFRKGMNLKGFKWPACTGDPNGFAINLNNDADQIDQQVEKILTNIRQSSVKLLLVILDKEDTLVYSRIKFYAETKYGIHVVNALATKMLKKGPVPDAQYLGNLALKFNLKLGGINHSLPADRLGFLQKGNTMVVGIDVTHPSPGQIKDGPSIAAVVASIDKNLSQWPCSLRTQRREFRGADEVVKPPQLGPMMIERLNMWKKNNKNTLPDRILVYRDGVSESQYEEVLRTEVEVIYQACERAGSKTTQVAFIVVGKRHHTRFYPTNIKETDRNYNKNGNANPLPGTVVDRGITMESGWDFFLQAHDSLKGTAKPAHYVVLRNDFKEMKPKDLENITHDLCYMFGRASRSVSVAPPARYADLACERGKLYLYKHLTIRPDRSNENDVYDPSLSPWTRSIHEGDGTHPLIETMFYI